MDLCPLDLITNHYGKNAKIEILKFAVSYLFT